MDTLDPDVQEDIEGTLRGQADAASRLEKSLEKTAKYSDDMLSTNIRLEKSLTKAGSIFTSLERTMRDMREEAEDIVGSIGASFPSGKGMLKEILDINRELTKMSATLGKFGSKDGALGAFKSATEEIGVAFDDARKIIGSLIDEGFGGNYSKAAKSIGVLTMATGAAAEGISETYTSLNKVMKMGDESVTSIYAGLMKIQQSNGLTKRGFDAVSTAIKGMAANMKGFGATNENVKTMANGLGRLASQMEKVGMSAQKAGEYVERLTNPETITENIGLYAQLGMSISDALSGNFDSTQMNAGLKDFANRVKEMGPIAGAAFAKEFNMSYNDALKMADMDIIGDTAVNEKDSFEVLNETLKKTQDSTAVLVQEFGKIKGMLAGFGPVGIAATMMIKSSFGKFISNVKAEIKDTFRQIVDDALKASGMVKRKGSSSGRNINFAGKDAGTNIEYGIKEFVKNNGSGLNDWSGIEKAFKTNNKALADSIIDSKLGNTNISATERNLLETLREQIGSGRPKPKETSKKGAWQEFAEDWKGLFAGLKGGAKSVGKRFVGEDFSQKNSWGKIKAVGGGIFRAGTGILSKSLTFLGPIAMLLGLLAPLLTDLIKDNKPLMDEIKKGVQIFKKSVTPIIEKLSVQLTGIVGKLIPLIEPLAEMLGAILDAAFSLLSPILDALIDILGPLVGLIKNIFVILKPFMTLLGNVVKMLLFPITLLTKLLETITGGVSGLFTRLFGKTEEHTKSLDNNTKALGEQNEREHVRARADGMVIATSASVAAPQSVADGNVEREVRREAENGRAEAARSTYASLGGALTRIEMLLTNIAGGNYFKEALEDRTVGNALSSTISGGVRSGMKGIRIEVEGSKNNAGMVFAGGGK